MKIAIKANHSRGREIISLLESLGGINSKGLRGDGEVYTYYIDKNNKINYDYAPTGYKVYTLEEFEKEFPFKVGDKVTPDYWTRLKHQYAGMAMQGLLSRSGYEIFEDLKMENWCIKVAHTLVQKLKESK